MFEVAVSKFPNSILIQFFERVVLFCVAVTPAVFFSLYHLNGVFIPDIAGSFSVSGLS